MTRILVAGDSSTQAARLTSLLDETGFEVERARNASEALTRCTGARFDLVLSDIAMPGRSAYELCRTLKGDPATRDLPIVLLTTLSDPMSIIAVLESGADNFITKPYEASDLQGRLNAILLQRRLRSERPFTAGIETSFMGKRVTITSDKEPILSLLVSTLENVLCTNHELEASQSALRAAERRLRTHDDQLARTNAQLQAVVSSMSHDLKEPLRAIEAFSGFLLEESAAALDERGKHHLDLVHASATRMRQLIDDLVTFARVGRQQGTPMPVSLADVAHDAFAALDVSGHEAGAEIVIQPYLPTVHGNAVLLRQLFANLLGNALKFRRSDVPLHVQVGWHPLDRGVEMTVADNGIGVPAEYRERVFGLFQRLHARDAYPGTGVGLALCKRIVDEHGGTIALEDTPGGGCTVRFTLYDPATIGAAPAP